MNGRNRSRCALLTKLGMGFLFALSALVPSMAFAAHGTVDNTPYWGQVCYPDANHCTTLTGQALSNQVVAAGFPIDLQESCTGGSGAYCTRANAQYWRLIWTWGFPAHSTDFYVPNPAQGVSGGFPNYIQTLNMNCVETNDYEYYTCTAGTGGPWGSWVLTVKY